MRGLLPSDATREIDANGKEWLIFGDEAQPESSSKPMTFADVEAAAGRIIPAINLNRAQLDELAEHGVVEVDGEIYKPWRVEWNTGREFLVRVEQ
jgi:hypothetical protein